MAVNITRCPHCQTTFRVRDEHLQIANGMVRCGSCLQVFKASDYFIEGSTPSPKAPIIPIKPVVQESKPSKNIDQILDDALIDDDFDLESITDDPVHDFNLRAPDSRPRPAPAETIDFTLDSSILELDDAGDLPFNNAAGNNPASKDDEDWAMQLLDDDDEEPITEQPKPEISLEDEFLITEETDSFDFIGDEDTTPIQALEDLVLTAQPEEQHSISSTVAYLQDDPLEFNQAEKRLNLAWGWLAGSAVLIVLLCAQFLYFNFDNLSRTPQWRSTYSLLCQAIGCQLPDIQDTSKISTQLFAVKSHPHYQGALLAETLLLNKASYEQPFPDILLSFQDLNNRVVASRRFKPEQYLSGELAGQKNIPAQVPVHIALEIVEPGAEAVSYKINLLANQ